MAEHEQGGWWHEWGALCIVAVLALPLFTPRVYGADEIKYFAALRSVYFDRDLHYANEYAHFIGRDPVAHAGLRPYMEGETPTGYRLNDAPIGTAVLWSPFYVAADIGVAAARSLGAAVPRDGYAWPYVWAVCLGSLFWGTAGMFLAYRLCRAYASRTASLWGVVAIWFASPVVFYLYITPAMAHANSMFAVSLFLLLWQRGRVDRAARGWVILGAAAGLMILVRELNWLLLLVLAVDETQGILHVVQSADGQRVRGAPLVRAAVVEWWRRSVGYLCFAVALGIVVAPQLYVYQTLNGTFGPTPFVVEKFSLLPRYAFAVLFSGFHGLFSWHPVTLVAVLGLAALWRRAPWVAAALVVFVAAQVLVIGSYETWWGGASFGARRFINCTAIFSLGLAVGFGTLRGRFRHLAAASIAGLVLWNAGLAVQYSVGLIPRDAPVSIGRIARNQVFEVPPRIAQIAWRFAFDRSSLYRTRP
ncbi:MAG: glycosyltransferase family 39 protein [Vicinamibacterales bacterium]|nr:glycosyltransferase family 39 protein [Vicinamibacterales bacterium]